MSSAPPPTGCLVVPTDFSPTATHAVDYGASLARRLGVTLALLHVVEPLGIVLPQTLADAQMLGATTTLEQLVEQCKGRGVTADFTVRQGPAASEIIGLARERHAEMIVMGTHGRSGLSRLLVGSVAEHVLRHAPCAVLTLKPQAEVRP
jgi:universal stress protein A